MELLFFPSGENRTQDKDFTRSKTAILKYKKKHVLKNI